MGQTNHDADRVAATLNFAIAANRPPSALPAESGVGAAPSRLSRAAAKPEPKTRRIADAQALEAHAERRRRLAAQARVENPARSEEEIEARLEQFGV